MEDLFDFDFCIPMLLPIMPKLEKVKLVDNLFRHGMIPVAKSKITPKIIKEFKGSFAELEKSKLKPDCIIYLIQYNENYST